MVDAEGRLDAPGQLMAFREHQARVVDHHVQFGEIFEETRCAAADRLTIRQVEQTPIDLGSGNPSPNLIRRGRIRKEMAHPKGRRARERVARAIDRVYGDLDAGPSALSPQDAAEILLVAQWFRLNPKERRRTVKPDVWLQEKRPA